MYSRDQMIAFVREQMPERRWLHTAGVMETSAQLARKFDVDVEKADLAALWHDVAKYWPIERQREIVIREKLGEDLLEYSDQLLHSHVGAYVAQREFGIDDEEVLDAIRYHTSGRRSMTALDKVICLADYIEPGRDFPGVEHIRELATRSLEEALIAAFDSTIKFLISKGEKIYPLTVDARNSLINQLKGR